MPVLACPVATVDAPIERVWSLVSDPRNLATWANAHFEAVEPEGAAHVGQLWHFSSSAFGRRWPVTMTVTSIAADQRSLGLDIALSFGMVNEEHLTLARLADGRTRVQFN